MGQCLTHNSQQARLLDFTLLDSSENSNPVNQPPTHPPTPTNMSTHLGSAHHNLPDNDTPASNSHEAEATAFAEAISKVLKTNNSSKPKLQEPDPFNGSNSHKLCTFILQCKLNFQDHKDIFEDDTDKVNYVLAFLKGTALDCFEPTILDSVKPLWLSDFDLFVKELEANFRTYDPVGEAEAELKGLCIHENHQAMKYFIKFQQLATCVQWGNAALC